VVTRIYYPHTAREEFQGSGGMWHIVHGMFYQEQFSRAAADLISKPNAFRTAMLRALTEWPNSCEMAFTTDGNNQRAWLGHAGCFLATGSPEECTRLGWHRLNDRQQYAANAAADDVIEVWCESYHGKRETVEQLDIFGDVGA
jgi:hypothetical protein